MRKSLIALLFFCCGVLLGQAPGTGTYNFSSFDSPGFDTVNVGNLNVHFSIPIVSRTGRGLPFQYNLVYDGLIWSPSSQSGVSGWTPDPSWGFHGQINNGTGLKGYMTYRTTSVSCVNTDRSSTHVPPTYRVSNFNYYDEFGRRHAFNYTFQPACLNGTPDNDVETGDGSSSDGSGYSLNTDDYSQVLTRSGQSFTVPINATGQNTMSITDPNGNTINGNGTGGFTDTLGVNALTINGSNPRTFTYPVTLQANNATTATATLSYQTYTVQTSFGCGISEYPATPTSLPSQLTLADGSTYQFSYEGTVGNPGNVTGRLATVTLPTGGTIQYQYSGGCSNTGIVADGSIAGLSRTVTATDASGSYTRSYTRAIGSGNVYTTTLQDEKGNQTLYHFAIDPGTTEYLETHRQTYQGSTTSGTQLLDRYTCYNGASTPCDNGPISLPISEVDVTESFNGGSQQLTKNMYDAKGTLLTDSKIFNGTQLLYELQQGFNSLGEMSSKTERDGNGTVYTFSYFNYDEGTVVGTSNVPQHATIAAGTQRGNLTSSHTSYGSNYLVSSNTYFDTGQPATATAQDGGTTTYGYDSTQGFTTSAATTPSSGVTLHAYAQFDPSTTMPISSTGVSGDSTTVNAYDRLMRPTDITLPSKSHVTASYDTPNHMVVNQTLDSSRTAHSEVQLDLYGRTSRTAKFNGQSSNQWYQVDYCYDSTGLLQFTSVAYQGPGFQDGNGHATSKHCSGSGTAYQYDALGRVTGTTTDDGTVTTTYQNRAVQTTDVNQVSRITQYDLLGRVASVCEISSTNYGGQPPSACSTDMGGTGYSTTYGYSLNSAYPVTTISQGGQTRTFQIDNAGRPMSIQEPERGTTTYSYTFNGTGLQVTRTRSKANQTNTAIKTNTATQYDTLGRIVSTTYDDNLTPNKAFNYDVSPSGLGWSTTPSNVQGRLAAMNTGNTGAQFSYDVSGNVTTMWQCAPSICNTKRESRPPLQYTYDLSGAVMSAFDGASGNIAYTRSAAGEVNSVTNQTYTDATSTPNLVSNVVNGPSGPMSWALGNGLQAMTYFDSMGRNAGTFVCTGSNQIGCQGGSAQTYGNVVGWKGSRVNVVCDSTFGANCRSSSYDDLNRLTALTSSEGSNTYSYDRWGNRTSANGVTYSYNGNNQQTNNSYDAVGNQIVDASHSYTYDAEGKILQVDSGATAIYVYDAMDRRVRVSTASSDSEYIFDPFGRRQSSWIVSQNVGNEGRIYWDKGLLANRSQNGPTYYHHPNYLGTERARTNYLGQTVTTQRSGPFGENLTQTISDSYGAQDNSQYTGQEHDAETNTDHFLYRQYAEGSGRWQSPDPYDGSYDPLSPQSMNRYAYLANNPLSGTDRSGLVASSDCGGGMWGLGDCENQDPCAADPTCVTVTTDPGDGPILLPMPDPPADPPGLGGGDPPQDPTASQAPNNGNQNPTPTPNPVDTKIAQCKAEANAATAKQPSALPNGNGMLIAVVNSAVTAARTGNLKGAAIGFVQGLIVRPVINLTLQNLTYSSTLNACLSSAGLAMPSPGPVY